MQRAGRIGVVVLAVLAAVVGAFATGAVASHQRCVVQLRVNVFGTTSPSSNWAPQGGLNTGQQAILRAVARGCAGGVDHISGRWVAGGTGALPRTPCGGAATCFLRVRAARQSAAEFQAFAMSPGGQRVLSDIVRVAWAGRTCAAAGTWVHQTKDIGSTTWTIRPGGQAQESGLGNATGNGTLSGHVLRIIFVTADQSTRGVYEWTLGPDCRSGSGTLRITAPATRNGETHRSTVTKSAG